jgi:hypothetical protein
MVLLDDSNSYWWLVRVVKDGSIGYLPAEHIETPTERLARLNKHRNVDLSATMLGDNNEKSKNPLKKAMRRRNAKTVNFGAPTYIDASDVDYSSDDDSEHGDFFNDDETLDGEEEDVQDQAEDIVVEPLRPKGQKDKPTEHPETNGHHEKQDTQRSSSERRPSSEEFFEAEGKNTRRDLFEIALETDVSKQNPPSVDPEMALYETPILSSKTTPRNPRRFHLHQISCAMPAMPAMKTVRTLWRNGKRYVYCH